MEFLKNNFYIACIISLFYFVSKLIIHKINSNLDKNEKKNAFKDSVLIFGISYITMYLKDNLYENVSTKTTVFTNEPNF